MGDNWNHNQAMHHQHENPYPSFEPLHPGITRGNHAPPLSHPHPHGHPHAAPPGIPSGQAYSHALNGHNHSPLPHGGPPPAQRPTNDSENSNSSYKPWKDQKNAIPPWQQDMNDYQHHQKSYPNNAPSNAPAPVNPISSNPHLPPPNPTPRPLAPNSNFSPKASTGSSRKSSFAPGAPPPAPAPWNAGVTPNPSFLHHAGGGASAAVSSSGGPGAGPHGGANMHAPPPGGGYSSPHPTVLSAKALPTGGASSSSVYPPTDRAVGNHGGNAQGSHAGGYHGSPLNGQPHRTKDPGHHAHGHPPLDPALPHVNNPSVPQNYARKSGPSTPLGVDTFKAPTAPPMGHGGMSTHKAALSSSGAPPMGGARDVVSRPPPNGGTNQGGHDGGSSSEFDDADASLRNPTSLDGSTRDRARRGEKKTDRSQPQMDAELHAQHLERKRLRDPERSERKRRRLEEDAAGGSGMLPRERERDGQRERDRLRGEGHLTKEQREEQREDRRRKDEKDARRRKEEERRRRHPELDPSGRPPSSSDPSRSKEGRERRGEKYRLHPDQPLQPGEHKKRHKLHPEQPIQPPLPAHRLRAAGKHLEGEMARKTNERNARVEENRRLLERPKSPLAKKEQEKKEEHEKKKLSAAEVLEMKRLAAAKKEKKDPVLITPLEKKEKAREAEIKRKKMAEEEKRKVESSHEQTIVKMLINLPTIREYIYLQEMERLTRILPHLANKCGLVFVDLFLTQQTSNKKTSHGVEAIGERSACERFTEEFDKVKNDISDLIARRIPVDKMAKLEEYENYLVISPHAYAWCMNNLDEINAGGVTIDLRPGGIASPPLLRLSGPAYRCEELWEYHLNNIRVSGFWPETAEPSRTPGTASFNIKTMERQRYQPRPNVPRQRGYGR